MTVPVERDAVRYYTYWPAKWYGEPGWRLAPSFPMVYMPTDTTQLGVYYVRGFPSGCRMRRCTRGLRGPINGTAVSS